MPTFYVTCYDGGVWDDAEPKKVEAGDEREAAEMVCGVPLIEDAGLNVRATVWAAGSRSAPKAFRQA